MNKNQARAILTNIHELNTRRFLGVITAIDSLLDLQAAINKANLTDLQKTALKLVFLDGHTHESAAEMLGIDRNTFTYRVKNALANLEEVYEYWRYHDETEAQAA